MFSQLLISLEHHLSAATIATLRNVCNAYSVSAEDLIRAAKQIQTFCANDKFTLQERNFAAIIADGLTLKSLARDIEEDHCIPE